MSRSARSVPWAAAAMVMATVVQAQVGSDAPRPAAASITADQISPPVDARSGRPGAAADLDVPQPVRSGADAVTTAEVSDRSDGRTLATSPVAGTDRCDQAASRSRSQLCRQRLETKADQYARPRSAPVTPEARLLLLTNPNGGRGSGTGQLGSVSGLEAPNGPSEQLAGALRDRGSSQDPGTTSAPGTIPGPDALPPSVPPIIVVPPK